MPVRKRSSVLYACLTLVLLLCGTAAAKKSESFPNINIKNFGQMDDRFYRGAQPKQEDYKALADLGIKTVIDLRKDPESYEKPSVEALGMRYVNIPMSDTEYPPTNQI